MTNEELNYCISCGIFTDQRHKCIAMCKKCQDKLKQKEKTE